MTFKREKELARKLLFEGTYIAEEEDEDKGLVETLFWHIDRIVISSPNFPQKYWDKLIRKKARNKFRTQVQVNEEEINTLLGLNKMAEGTEPKFDFRYYIWLTLGVVITNGQFLYRIGYLGISICGVVYSRFFYAFHLIDVVLSFPMLKAILQSVTHNLKQVCHCIIYYPSLTLSLL